MFWFGLKRPDKVCCLSFASVDRLEKKQASLLSASGLIRSTDATRVHVRDPFTSHQRQFMAQALKFHDPYNFASCFLRMKVLGFVQGLLKVKNPQCSYGGPMLLGIDPP